MVYFFFEALLRLLKFGCQDWPENAGAVLQALLRLFQRYIMALLTLLKLSCQGWPEKTKCGCGDLRNQFKEP